MQLMKILLLLTLVSSNGFCARILGILPMPSRSHGILMESLMRELGNRGHHVTYITPQPPAQGPIPNLTLIDMPDLGLQMMKQNPGMKDKRQDLFKGMSPLFMFTFGLTAPKTSDFILKQPKIQELIHSDQKFDLILGEVFLAESLLAGFSYRFQAPIVGVMPFLPNIWGNYMVGNPAPTSYIPEPTLGLSTDMTLCERIKNFVFGLAWDIYHPLIYMPLHDEVMRKHFGRRAPPIDDIIRSTSLVLVNHHHSLAFPRPYLPNMIEVGGMHVAKAKPLPEDFKKYMDDSKNGVILFNMGSNLKSSEMDPEKIKEILRAFAKLPYNVLWKFEEELQNLPKNVRVNKWLPQSDLLAHPNLKLFITHGGLLSTTEAVTRGVPVLGIPILGDQPLNMKLTEQAGLGRTMQFSEISEDRLYNEIMELTTNSRYREAAKLKSAVFQDDPLPALERAMWWIEYVLRYNGAPHLSSSAQRLSWYQLHQLDVIAVLAVGIVVTLFLSLQFIKLLLRKICGKKKTNKKKVKKN